jgi:hypothetical protein
MTKVQQYQMVGEGLAIGCLSLGITKLPSSKIATESAFRWSWSRWMHARSFPAIRADLFRNDGLLQIVGRSERRRGATVAAWQVGAELVPYLFDDDMSYDEAADSLRGPNGLNLSGWQQLAQLFSGKLNPVDGH